MNKKTCSLLFAVLLAGLAFSPLRAHEMSGGKETTVTGEVIDNFCYVAMGARGESHRQCGIDCARKGMPIGLLEEGTNKIYTLLPPKDKSPLPENVIDKMGKKTTITGDSFTKGGSLFLTVESVK